MNVNPMFLPLSRHVLLAVAALSLAILASPPAFSARNEANVSPMPGPYELVVIEVEGCSYCEVFRRDVMPAFVASREARELPIRFLDLNTPEAAKLELTEGPLTIVPTVLLVKANREVGRAPGYMGPEGFFTAIRWMLGHTP